MEQVVYARRPTAYAFRSLSISCRQDRFAYRRVRPFNRCVVRIRVFTEYTGCQVTLAAVCAQLNILRDG